MTLWRKWQVSKQNNIAELNNDITFVYTIAFPQEFIFERLKQVVSESKQVSKQASKQVSKSMFLYA